MDTPILNFGPGKSGKGITNINESTNNKKQIDLSNLKIKKNPEEIIEKDFQGNLSTLSTGTGFFEGLNKTGNDFKNQISSFETSKETLPTFNIQPKNDSKEININESTKQAILDIKAGMPIEKFEEFYPELLDKKNVFIQLSKDLSAGMPESEIGNLYPELFGGIETSGKIDTISKEPGIINNFKQGIDNVIGGGISQVPEIIGNTFGFLADIITPKEFEGLGDIFREGGVKDKEDLQNFLGVDPDAFTTGLGEFGSEILSLFIPGGQGKLLSKFPQASEKIIKLLKIIDTIGEKSPKLFNLLKSSLTGAKEFGKFSVVDKGIVTKEDLLFGAVATPFFNKFIKGIGWVNDKIAEKLELSGLLNPAKLDKVAKQLKDKGIEKISSVADFLLEKTIKGSKEKISKTLFNDAMKSKNTVDKLLGTIKEETFDINSEKGLKIILENLKGKIGLEDDLSIFTKMYEKLQEKGLNPTEKNTIKRGLDAFINIFKDSGEVIAGTNKLGSSKVRNGIQKQIEGEAEKAGIYNINSLNKNTQVSFTLSDAIARKDASDQASALINAFAPSGVGALVGGVSSQGDVFDRLKGVIGGAILGKVAGSTTVKTNVANILKKLNFIDKLALQKFIDTKGGIKLETGLFNKLFSNE